MNRNGTTWRLLTDDGVGAAEGLALDEALMAGVGRDAAEPCPTLRLYTYASHAALVGRYQTLDAEVDLDACNAAGTGVSRRPTGGGAIVMGRDQLGVALVLPEPAVAPRELIPLLAEGVTHGLGTLGVEAAFGGKNDLLVGGRKVAGLGLYRDVRGGILFHASVLADLDVPFMLSVLRIPAAKLGGKAVAAVAERVTTVRREAGAALGAGDVRAAVARGFAQRFGVRLAPDTPDPSERSVAAALVTAKYAHPSWLHERGARPDGTGSAVYRGAEGTVRVYVAAQANLVKNVLFTGDFNVVPDGLRQLEAALRWRRLDAATLGGLVAEVRAGLAPGADVGWRRDGDVVAAVLAAASAAADRGAAEPVRPAGSCYFPETPPVRSRS